MWGRGLLTFILKIHNTSDSFQVSATLTDFSKKHVEYVATSLKYLIHAKKEQLHTVENNTDEC